MAVVFVNFHSENLIVPRAERLTENGFLVVVADNSGTFPVGKAGLVLSGRNDGFGAGCNRAASALGPELDVLCFHNPDVDAAPSTLRALEATLRGQGRPGIVAPAERVGGEVRSIGYHYPTPGRELLLGLRSLFRLARPPGERSPSSSRAGRGPGRPLGRRGRRFPAASLLVVARPAFDAVGGFDERYFLYAEDLDLWHRVRATGHDTAMAPDLVVNHLWSRGSPLDAASREVLRWLGVELFAELTGDDWQRMRSVHRVLLRAVTPHCRSLAHAVGLAWGRRRPPAEVLAGLRPFLVSGSFREDPL